MLFYPLVLLRSLTIRQARSMTCMDRSWKLCTTFAPWKSKVKTFQIITESIFIWRLIWRALFQTTLSANPKIDVAMRMPTSQIMFCKSAIQKYVHIYACEKLFNKTQSLKLALALRTHFLEWRLTRFGKELVVCVRVDYFSLFTFWSYTNWESC